MTVPTRVQELRSYLDRTELWTLYRDFYYQELANILPVKVGDIVRIARSAMPPYNSRLARVVEVSTYNVSLVPGVRVSYTGGSTFVADPRLPFISVARELVEEPDWDTDTANGDCLVCHRPCLGDFVAVYDTRAEAIGRVCDSHALAEITRAPDIAVLLTFAAGARGR